MTLKRKLLFTFLVCGLVPTVAVSLLGSSSARRGMNHLEETAAEQLALQAYATLESVRDNKRLAIEQYFGMVQSQIETFADDLMVVEAMKEFRNGFPEHATAVASAGRETIRGEVKRYYEGDFAREYESKAGARPAVEATLAQLDEASLALQHTYIAANPNPLGSKHELVSAGIGSAYDQSHARFHPRIRHFLQEFGYYDVFLIDDETGDVVYTVFKEVDYATSLVSGPWKDSGLGEVFRQACATTARDAVVFADFDNYGPSYEAPAGFIAAPIYDRDERIGVVAFQVPLDRITAVMAERGGLGERGESYLVGPDHLMRSDSHCDPAHRTVVASFRNPGTGRVETEAARSALAGRIGRTTAENYAAVPVLAAFAPLEIAGLTWGLVVELPEDEALAAVAQMAALADAEEDALRNWILITTAVVLGAVGLLGIWQANTIGGLLGRVVLALTSGAAAVNRSASEVAGSSQELAGASRSQAASLEETSSSLEELSAMTAHNAENANQANTLAVEARSAAERSDATMEELRGAIEKINDSSGRISSIIKVIEEIAFQTNLLALNAAVEAARAGDQGKGFAVVAGEVRNLAQKATAAAQETAHLIEESVTSARQGKDAMTGVEGVLREIAGQVTQVSGLMDGISSATAEQARGVEQISRGADRMDQMTQQTAAAAEQAANMSAELSRQSAELQSAVDELQQLVGGTTTITTSLMPNLRSRRGTEHGLMDSGRRAA